MDSEFRAGDYRKIERGGKRLRNVLNKIGGVHHKRSRPGGKIECTPGVPAPPGLECSGKGWWTMLRWEGVDPDAGVDAGGGADVDAASCMLIVMTFRSIKS